MPVRIANCFFRSGLIWVCPGCLATSVPNFRTCTIYVIHKKILVTMSNIEGPDQTVLTSCFNVDDCPNTISMPIMTKILAVLRHDKNKFDIYLQLKLIVE